MTKCSELIGKEIKRLLTNNQIKQITFAKAMNISPSRLSNYLSGKREPDLKLLMKMAYALGTDLNHFRDLINTHLQEEAGK